MFEHYYGNSFDLSDPVRSVDLILTTAVLKYQR